MSKYFMLAVLMLGLAACKAPSRDAEAKAYAAGCTAGINVVLVGLGATPDAAKIQEHCTQEAQDYLKNNK